MKKIIIAFILLDNFLTNLPKKVLFRSRWVLEGKCRKCGTCCKEIYLRITPRQLSSKLFTELAVRWTSWIFDFELLRIDYENCYLVFSCKHLRSDGKCGSYFWRPNICRNYPLVDYFEEPKVLPDCGFRARPRNML